MANEQSEPKRRRSALKKELDAFADLVNLLRPLTPEQRTRLFNAALTMMPENLAKGEIIG